MKKELVSLLAVLLLLTGCAAGPDADDPQRQDARTPGLEDLYTVPEGWVRAEAYSTDSKIFYVEDGHEGDAEPDNISVNLGTNRYSAEEHESFRDAIVRQLLTQIQGVDAELTGDGTYTEQGYVVYIFTITEAEVVTKQYYIVGDRRYCLVHLTSFTGAEGAFDAAQAIADSFIWDDAPEA